MKILHLTLSFRPGGRREAIATLARELLRQNVSCDLACLEEMGCNEEVVADIFGRRTVLNRSETPGAVRTLRSYCREHGINVIHCHDAASQWVAAQVKGVRSNPKVLMTFHRSLGFESARLRDKVRNAFASLPCSAIVVGSRERAEHFKRENYVPGYKIVRIPFGIDTDRFQRSEANRVAVRHELGLGHDDILIGMAGHYGPEKGIDIGLRAFQQISGQDPKRAVRIAVLGTGPAERQALMQSLAGPRVNLLGFRADAQRWFSAFDIFLHSPRQEAFGLVIAEAMAAGLPVVATCVGGVPDLVREGQTGFLANSTDPASLAKALQKLIDSEQLRHELGRYARLIAVSEYSKEEYGRQYLRLYETISDLRIRKISHVA